MERQVGDSHTLSFVEKEAMAPRTTGGLVGGMAHGGHIRHENYEFTSIKGSALVSTNGHGPNLYNRDLGPVACGGHTLRTTPDGSILEFTYVGGGQYP